MSADRARRIIRIIARQATQDENAEFTPGPHARYLHPGTAESCDHMGEMHITSEPDSEGRSR